MIVKNMSTALEAGERETNIRYDYVTKKWYISTSVPRHRTRCRKAGYKCTCEYYYKGVLQIAEFETEKPSAISFRKVT